MQANLTPEKIELMDRYLDHELSDQELEAFENELAERPGMLRELREYTLFRSTLTFMTSQQETHEVRRPFLRHRNPPRSKIVKLLRVITWLLVVLTLFAGYLIFSGNDLFEVLLHPFEK